MVSSRFLRLYLVISVIMTMALGCSDSSTESQPPDQSSVLSSRIFVSVIPGGSEDITISAVNQDGTPDNITASCEDPSVATVSCLDSVVTVTGVDYGVTDLAVTCGSGLTKTIPVQVYNHRVLDSGELTISVVDTFEYRWHDQGSGCTHDGSFYHPVTDDGFRALGSLGFSGYDNPQGDYAMTVVKADPGSDALAEPEDYSLLWFYRRPIFPYGYDTLATFWIPTAPEGYRAMGLVAQNGPAKPPLSDVVCVREDLTTEGEAGSFIWNDDESSMPRDLGCWNIYPPETGPHSMTYLQTGTFVGWNYWNRPATHPVMYVLKIDLPMLSEAPYQTYVPKLSSYDTPPEETVPMMAKSMLTPCTIVNDLQYVNNIGWRVANSPFYRLERYVYYKLLYHNHNQTSEIQTNSVTITSGVTTGESQTFWEETSVSITAEAGVSIECFSGHVSTTVSRTFGYSTQTSVEELEQTEVSSSINTPPGKAAALWQKYNRFVLKRHNGTDLEPVATWEFGIDSYTTDEWPD
jgi:hypothetical protein